MVILHFSLDSYDTFIHMFQGSALEWGKSYIYPSNSDATLEDVVTELYKTETNQTHPIADHARIFG